MENGHSSHPHNWVPAVEQPLFTRRRLRVVSIGAGFANLMFAYKIMYEWKAEDWIDHVIYEKNVSTRRKDGCTPQAGRRTHLTDNSTRLEEPGWKIGIRAWRVTYVQHFTEQLCCH
jgi:hypothetical protein